jgi:indolepyruvate ferredoxin oxidoreductase
MDQVRLDRAAGLRVGALVSGYPGSPLAGLDQAFRAAEPICRELDVRLLPGLNEELAVSTIAGTQHVDLFPHSRYDGAIGMWFGKAPGVDRSLDALRHSNFLGTSRYGGALAVAGDDPACKSSSLPSRSDMAFAHAHVPVLAPADAADVLDLGLHGYALSRYSGLWVGLKLVADVTDGGVVFELPAERPEAVLPKFQVLGVPFEHRVDARLLTPHVQRIEADILHGRLEAARRYAYANGLDRIEVKHKRDRVGIAAGGRLYREVRGALERLGLDDAALKRLGIRLYRLRMVFPVEERRLLEFADGLDEIVVVDDRPGFVEEQVRSALCNAVDHPLVIGQRTETGEPWLSRHSEVSAESLALVLGQHLAERLGADELRERTEALRARGESGRHALEIERVPHFCSGCPHSTSTQLPQGTEAGGGIGCHTMALLMDRNVRFIGAMGSEGAHWIGLAPFVDTPHLFQNLGDGTYFHSGRQAVRAAVESGVSVTYKLLYNGVVAMTGGQDAVGAKPVARIVRDLLSDGVRRVIAVSGDRELLELADLREDVQCIEREEYDEAMRVLAREPGVTVLVYDAICANQKQRLERRGQLAPSAERILIHEDVCEGCGDCGRKSTCASLRPTRTPLGRKTRVHETSCTDDRSCLAGDCPAFLSVGSPLEPSFDLGRLPETLPEPETAGWSGERYSLYLVGIGSTGVVTSNAILLRAAELEGLYALHLDQTGLAQRGGKVVSHCIVAREPIDGCPRVAWGDADTALAFDPIGAADAPSLRVLDPDRTRVFASTDLVPTHEMVANPALPVPSLESALEPVRRLAKQLESLSAESLAEAAFGDSRSANVVLLGFACQRGGLPFGVRALERAISDVGVAVERNLEAFRLGRAVACDAGLAGEILAEARPPSVAELGSPEDAARKLGRTWVSFEAACTGLSRAQLRGRLLRSTAGLALALVDYQGRRYARRFVRAIEALVRAEIACDTSSCDVSEAAARELYRAMAYKDEYEVARLLVAGPFRRWLERRARGPVQLRYHLHPPLLRAMGRRRKLELGPWFEPFLQLLAGLRRLRGTPFDPFARTRARRAERALVRWYLGVLGRVARGLEPRRLPLALEIVAAPERIRGFEQIKLEQIEAVRAEVERKLEALASESAPG